MKNVRVLRVDSLNGDTHFVLLEPQLSEKHETAEDFDEAETGLILSKAPIDRLPPETAHKLSRSYMTDYLEQLPRNFRALLK